MKTNSINQYHNTYKNNTIYTKKSNVLLSNVSFKGNITRSPIMTTTYDAAKKLYTDYEKSLDEVSIKDIKKSALNISTDMQIPIKDVLYTMQKLTQFANLRSVSKIGERLQKDNIATIGDTKGSMTLKHRRTNSTIPSPIIKNAIENGADSFDEVQEATNCGKGCGSCLAEAKAVVEELLKNKRD